MSSQFVSLLQLFEKKNQKSAQSIAQLQKKLEEYQKRLRDLEENGVQQKHSHKVREKVQGLKNVGGNIMNKPKEFAHKLRHKFGSADNLVRVLIVKITIERDLNSIQVNYSGDLKNGLVRYSIA